jgi:hypothetical protein
MTGEKNLTKLIREEVRRALQDLKIIGTGNTTISSDGDIHLVTKGTHAAYYNGTEIGTGGGTIYLNPAHTMWITADENTLVLHVPAGGDWKIEEGT